MKNIFKVLYLFLVVLLGIIFFTQRNRANVDAREPKSEQVVNYNPDNLPWNLVLVNRENPIPENWQMDELVELSNGRFVESRIYPDLQEMFDDMRKEGHSPFVTWGYRSRQVQTELFEEAYNNRLESGYSQNDAREDAAKSVAIPGTSEHEIALAVDIIDEREGGHTYDVYNWLSKNAYKYGFILRYPDGKTEITKILFEPWHYRYVGREAAREIFERNITLEEYIEKIR